jgi:hypothetical protein
MTQFTGGVPVMITESDDQSLQGNTGLTFAGSTDEPNLKYGTGQSFYGDKNPRHGKSFLNNSLFSQETLGGQGNSPRRFLHSPGEENWNMALLKDVKLHESISLEIRAEFFNLFNHAQFYGPTVNGNYATGPSFGQISGDAGPRVGQVAAKLTF